MSERRFPKVGDVINYIFLFAHEAKTRDEGVKARPCVVIMADARQQRVLVAPLTTQGDRYADTLAIPDEVCRIARLRGPFAVVLSELNIFTWLGYDVRPLHGTNDITIGRFPPGFTAKVMTAIKNQRPVNRD
jgi:PemK-like, MazF-like toxin of type II toxin-antitoxin system